MELARQLRTKREERGLSQDEVAKAIFVSRQTISNWENDKTYPDMQSLLLLSQLFDTSIDDLVKGDAARIQQAVKQDSHKMRLLSYGMVGFSVLAFLFLLGFSLAWQEPSGFARMSKGNIAGASHVHRALCHRARHGYCHRPSEEEARHRHLSGDRPLS